MRPEGRGGPSPAGFQPATLKLSLARSISRPGSAWPNQIIAGIADPRAAGREGDRTRLLNGVEHGRHDECGDCRKCQGRNKDFHGASPTLPTMYLAIGISANLP